MKTTNETQKQANRKLPILCVNCAGAYLDDGVNTCCGAPMRAVTLAEAWAMVNGATLDRVAA